MFVSWVSVFCSHDVLSHWRVPHTDLYGARAATGLPALSWDCFRVAHHVLPTCHGSPWKGGRSKRAGEGPMERAAEYTRPTLRSEQLCRRSLLGKLTFRTPVPLKPPARNPKTTPVQCPIFAPKFPSIRGRNGHAFGDAIPYNKFQGFNPKRGLYGHANGRANGRGNGHANGHANAVGHAFWAFLGKRFSEPNLRPHLQQRGNHFLDKPRFSESMPQTLREHTQGHSLEAFVHPPMVLDHHCVLCLPVYAELAASNQHTNFTRKHPPHAWQLGVIWGGGTFQGGNYGICNHEGPFFSGAPPPLKTSWGK